MNKVVYIHKRKDNDSIFYVGMGSKERPYNPYRRSKEWNSIASNGYYVEIIKSGLSKKLALELESELIQSIGLKNLTNKTVGGQGGNHYNNIEVDQYNSDGVLVNSFVSMKQAERKTGIHHSNIGDCLVGKRSYAGGFYWVKKGDKPKIKEMKNPRRNKVVLDLSTGVFYNSSREVSDLYDMNSVTLWRYLTGKRENITNFKYV